MLGNRTVLDFLDRYFQIGQLGSNFRTEIVAGATTFLAMSYIIAVNPAILADAGIAPAAAAFATCLVSGLATIGMGFVARLPLAVAPGMGLNAFFAYSVVQGYGLTWQEGLGVVFVSGVGFMLLTLLGVRRAILRTMPPSLLPAIASGIGLFLVMVGLKNAGLIRAHESTFVTRGDLSSPGSLLAIATLLFTATLLSRGVRAGIVIGIVGASLIGVPLGLSGVTSHLGSGALDAIFSLDIGAALSFDLVDIIFAMLFVDMFDSLGSVIGVVKKARLEDSDGQVPRLGRVMGVDAAATVFGALAGTSTMTTYIESAAGIEAGGRTGLTSVVTGGLFLLAIPLVPFVGLIPSVAAAAPLIIIGAMTVGLASEIDWEDIDTAVPALFVIAGMPLMFSIADGLAMGVVSFSALKILRGHAGQVSWMVHALALLFVARFALLG